MWVCLRLYAFSSGYFLGNKHVFGGNAAGCVKIAGGAHGIWIYGDLLWYDFANPARVLFVNFTEKA